jgi:hypothetical protein
MPCIRKNMDNASHADSIPLDLEMFGHFVCNGTSFLIRQTVLKHSNCTGQCGGKGVPSAVCVRLDVDKLQTRVRLLTSVYKFAHTNLLE